VSDSSRVLVVTGLGGMGSAIARRMGSGRTVVLADVDPAALKGAADQLRGNGYEVVEQVTDVGEAASVAALAEAANRLGRVEVLAHTAGLSPVQAQAAAILRVDLLGTALVLDAFAPVIAPGGAGVFIASMAGTTTRLDPHLERRLATVATADLLALPELAAGAITEPGAAYGISKRANQVRVQAAAIAWGRRGARVNTISPGIISTPMGAAELGGPSGDAMRGMLAVSTTGRIGTPEDIASAVEFLAGPQASFITGTDLLVDGGVVAAIQGGVARPSSEQTDLADGSMEVAGGRA
jgi:NAD(P)-dependent dehydrogenase (short-subunit alcohol dehydrogenase family)